MDPRMAKELDEFEQFVDDFASQMDSILKGKPDAAETKTGFSRTSVNAVDEVSVPAALPDLPASPAAAAPAADAPSLPHASEPAAAKQRTKTKEKASGAVKERKDVIDYSKWEHIDTDDEDDGDDDGRASQHKPKETKQPARETAAPKRPAKDNTKSQPRHIQAVYDAVESLRGSGNAEFSRGAYEKAVGLYTEAIATCRSPPQDLLLHKQQASAGVDPTTASTADPFAFLDRVLKPQPIPVDPRLHTNRALALAKLRRWREALDDCRAALDLDRVCAKAHWIAVEACRQLALFDEARIHARAFKRCIDEDAAMDAATRARLTMELDAAVELVDRAQAAGSVEVDTAGEQPAAHDAFEDARLASASSAMFVAAVKEASARASASGTIRLDDRLERVARAVADAFDMDAGDGNQRVISSVVGQIMGSVGHALDATTMPSVLLVLAGACRKSPIAAMNVAGSLDQIAAALVTADDARRGSFLSSPAHITGERLVDLLCLLAADHPVCRRTFTQVGVSGAKIGRHLVAQLSLRVSAASMADAQDRAAASLVRSVDLVTELLLIDTGSDDASQAPSAAACIFAKWHVGFDSIVGTTLKATEMAADAFEQCIRRSSGPTRAHTSLGRLTRLVQCVFHLSRIHELALAVRAASPKLTGVLAAVINTLAPHIADSTSQRSEAAMRDLALPCIERATASLHNIMAATNASLDAPADARALSKSLAVLASGEPSSVANNALRLLCRLAQSNAAEVMPVIDEHWDALRLLQRLPAPPGTACAIAGDAETTASVLQLACVWLQSDAAPDKARARIWCDASGRDGLEALTFVIKAHGRGQVNSRIVGNAVLCAAECARQAPFAERLVRLGLVDELLAQSEIQTDPRVVQNLFICCAVLCKTVPQRAPK
ncbi:hypothetical protein HK105_204484 [Polyrhizophydium stewartii]|uniref:Tetratricopeptide repeat protein n=1 Tax=Polyrhizophydium stewartii TaxID=2732419 RepID=A0ABR4N949_9FUNG